MQRITTFISTILVMAWAIGGWTGELSSSAEEMTRGFGDESIQVVPAAAFTTNGYDPMGAEFNLFFGNLVGTAGSTSACVQAPVYLPHGARITSMYASLVDNDADDDITVTLYRIGNREMGDSNHCAYLVTSGQSTAVEAWSDTTINFPRVDYPAYSYVVTTCLHSPDTKLYSVRIYYTTPLFTDGFECGETWVWSETTP